MADASTPHASLEPGASSDATLTPRHPFKDVPGPPEWGALKAKDAVNFGSVEPLKIPKGTKLYRVFGHPTAADPYSSWEVGKWWSRNEVPQTEAAWRAGYAVEVAWNGGQAYVEWTTPAVIYGWVGTAAAQPGEDIHGHKVEGTFLPGGAEQIFIDPDKQSIGGWKPSVTPWTPSPATSIVPPAPPPVAEPDVATLSSAVARLADTLDVLANDARARNLNGDALSFQAERIRRAHDQLQPTPTADDAHINAVVRGLIGISRHVDIGDRSGYDAVATLTEVVRQAHTIAASTTS